MSKRAHFPTSSRPANNSANFPSKAVVENKNLPTEINHFERHWLQEVILNAIIIVSDQKDLSLEKANEVLNNDSSIIFEVLSELFNTDIRLINEDTDEETTGESRLYTRL